MRNWKLGGVALLGHALVVAAVGCSSSDAPSDGSADYVGEDMSTGSVERSSSGHANDGFGEASALGLNATATVELYAKLLALLSNKANTNANDITCTQNGTSTAPNAYFATASTDPVKKAAVYGFNQMHDNRMRSTMCTKWGASAASPGPLRTALNTLLTQASTGATVNMYSDGFVRYGNGSSKQWGTSQTYRYGTNRDGNKVVLPFVRLRILANSSAVNYNASNGWNTCVWYRDRFSEVVKQLNSVVTDGDIQYLANWDSPCGVKTDDGTTWFYSNGAWYTNQPTISPYLGKTYPSEPQILNFVFDPAFDGTYPSANGTKVGLNSTATDKPFEAQEGNCYYGSTFAQKQCVVSPFTPFKPNYIPHFEAGKPTPTGLCVASYNGTPYTWVAKDGGGQYLWEMRMRASSAYCGTGGYRCRAHCPGGGQDAANCVQSSTSTLPPGVTISCPP